MKMKNTYLVIALLWASIGVTRTDPNIEAEKINGPAESTARCWDISAEDCREERQNWFRTGCISDWALKELEKKVGPNGEEGGFPVCTSKQILRRWCYCGCFHPETLIFVFDKILNERRYVAAKDIAELSDRYELVTLDEQANLRSMSLRQFKIEKKTRAPEKSPLVVLHLENGTELKLSSQHAVLLNDGTMVVAEELTTDQLLLDVEGHPIGILEISREDTKLEVINFMTEGETFNSHILIAEGIVVGDLAWQNELVPALNQKIID